jgi:ribosomal protein S9
MNTVFQKDKIGLGKRKRAVARVFLVPGEGKVVINKVSGEKYLQYNTNYLNDILYYCYCKRWWFNRSN